MSSALSAAEAASLTTVGDWIRWAASRFAAADLHFGHGTASAADEAHALVLHALDLGYPVPAYFYGCALTAGEKSALLALIRRRVEERRPLPYLLGEAWFCGVRFAVDERVLIPRSPIAELIEQGFLPWLAQDRPVRVLDMCTGSGCIAIATAMLVPHAQVDAADIDAGALEVARRNVADLGVAEQVTLYESDLFAGLPACRYDLIVSNPPYVPGDSLAALPDEYRHEPGRALLASEGGLEFVSRLLCEACAWLTDDGTLIVEVGESADAFVAAYPELDVTWCEFERGGEGVFAVGARTLSACFADQAALTGRS